jgi:hypothetical protein
MAMRLVYQLARRNVVKVAVKSSAGSGIIWKIDDDIVIVSNKHLLMEDVEAKVTFCNGEVAEAKVIGYSQQYDIGFVRVGTIDEASAYIREIYNAVPVSYPYEAEEDKAAFIEKYGNTMIMQVGVDYDNIVVDYTLGTVKGLEFSPLFNTNVLVSGGGIFDDNGRLLGMISGGDVAADSKVKESQTTYSLPAGLIEAEYELLSEQ